MEPTLTLPVEGGYDLIQSYVNQEKQPGKQVKIPGRVTRPSRSESFLCPPKVAPAVQKYVSATREDATELSSKRPSSTWRRI